MDSNGNIDIYNGTFSPTLTTINPATGAVVGNTTLAGWSTINNTTYGGLAAYGNYVFATDETTASGGDANGIVRFNINDFTAQRFDSGLGDYIQLTMGKDGLLYALTPSGSPGGRECDVFDPNTMARVKHISFGFRDLRDIAVDASGKIYAVTMSDPHIYVFDNNGTLLSTVTTAHNGYTGISINNKGQLVADGGGNLLFTDIAFSSFNTVPISSQSPVGTFVSWIEPPLGGSGDTPLQGVVAGDSVSADTSHAVGTFASTDVGKNITVTVTGITLSGPQASDYTLAPVVLGADITPAAISVTGVTANNKAYDGTNTAALNVSAATLQGVLPGDDVKLTGNMGTFASKDVGATIAVAASGLSLTGARAGDYTLTLPNINAAISPATLTVTGVSANDKTYDGTSAAQIKTAGATLIGIFGNDSVSLNASKVVGAFAAANVGKNIAVTVTGLSLSGPQAGDYVLVQPTVTANINPLPTTTTVASSSASLPYGTPVTLTATVSESIPPVQPIILYSDTTTGANAGIGEAIVGSSTNPGNPAGGKALPFVPTKTAAAYYNRIAALFSHRSDQRFRRAIIRRQYRAAR